MGAVDLNGRHEFLLRYFDPELEVPKLTIPELVSAQQDRLARELVISIHSGSIPRRLGGDASDQELAADKKRAKRVSWALKQSLAGWSKKFPKLPVDEELRVAGAQLVWQTWYEEFMTEVNEQARIVVTWSVQNDEQRWGRSAVVKFENELNWVSYAMRD